MTPLSKKDTIPEVSLKIPFIKEIQTINSGRKLILIKLKVRINLRDLIKYLDLKIKSLFTQILRTI